MSDPRSRIVVFAGLAVVFAGAVAAALFWLAPPGGSRKGPRPIVWDHEACTSCKMSIGEPRYAAEIRLDSGKVLPFDDAGCLMTWQAAHPAARRHEAGVFFHDSHGDGWIAAADVTFVQGGPTPMGFDLVAVRRSTAPPGALTLAQARTRVARRAGAQKEEAR